MVKDPTEVCFFKAWNTTKLGLMQHSENLPWIRRLWWYWNLHCLLILIIARFSLWAALSSTNHIHLWKPWCQSWLQVSMLMVLKHFSDRVLTENFMPLFPCVNTKCKSSSVDTAGFETSSGTSVKNWVTFKLSWWTNSSTGDVPAWGSDKEAVPLPQRPNACHGISVTSSRAQLWRFCTSNSLSLISPRMVGRTSTTSQLCRRRSSWCSSPHAWQPSPDLPTHSKKKQLVSSQLLYKFSFLGCCLLHITVC